MDRRVSRRRARLRLSAPQRAVAALLLGALLLAVPLASCLIPEPKASHTSDELGEISPSIFTEEPGLSSEPDLGVPPTPPQSAAPASEVAANPEGESSASSASGEPGSGQSAAPAASSAEAQSPPAEPAPSQPEASAGTEDKSNAAADPPIAPESQEPAPPDLPSEPAVVPADNNTPPGLAQAPKEVQDLLKTYYEAFSKQDWGTAAACFWDGAIFSSMRLRTNENGGETAKVIVQPARAFFAALISGESVLEPVVGQFVGAPQVLRSGDVLHAWCRYEAHYGPENEKMSWRRYDSVTLVLHEEVWKFTSLVQSRSVDL